MKSVSLSSSEHLTSTVKPSALDAMARKVVLKKLAGLVRGGVTLSEGLEEYRFGSTNGEEPQARITVQDPRFYSEVAFGGTIGGGELLLETAGGTLNFGGPVSVDGNATFRNNDGGITGSGFIDLGTNTLTLETTAVLQSNGNVDLGSVSFDDLTGSVDGTFVGT